MRTLLRWILVAVAVVATSAIMQVFNFGFTTHVKDTGSAITLLCGVAVLSFVNATLGRLLKWLTIPLNCLTLGLFSLVINAGMLLIVSRMDLGFSISGEGLQAFVNAFIASLLISSISGILGSVLSDKKKDD